MAAPTSRSQQPQKPLANGEPSTHGQRERVFDINPEITDGAFDLCVPKEDLNSAQIARCLVDDGRLRSAK
jgi:hypothetical protein